MKTGVLPKGSVAHVAGAGFADVGNHGFGAQGDGAGVNAHSCGEGLLCNPGSRDPVQRREGRVPVREAPGAGEIRR